MKTMRTMAITMVLSLLASAQALAAAVDTSQTYSSGLLIGLFLAFCALLVVVQMIPSIMMLVGFIKGLARRTESQADATAGAPEA
jgi:hypothetical protein